MIKNSPCGRHAGYPHIMFIEHLLSRCSTMQFVIPAAFMTIKVLGPFRQWILNNYYVKNITVVDNKDNKQFNIEMDCIVILQLCSMPTITTYNDNFEVDLEQYGFWPMYKNKEDVLLFSNTKNNVGVVANTKPPGASNYISFAIRDFCTMKSWRLNSVKESVKHHGYILFDTLEEAELNWEYYNTEEFRLCLRMLQSINKVQPYWIEYIGIKKARLESRA